jgi:adsorption protein B
VGTGFARSALERLPGAEEDRIFDPKCLTEDYEIGCRFFALGCPQLFVPVEFDAAGPIATREYFPRTLRAAVRQRSRWVAGNSLQAWERHGWRNPPGQIYWFWRDRKGLVGNLLSPFTTLTFVYGLATRIVDWAMGDAWHFGSHIPLALSAATLWISLAQAAMRMYASARVYGGSFALAAPARMLWGNVVNSLATAEAVRQFFAARVRRHALVWRKTEHVYPPPGARENGRLRLGQILVGMERISLGELDDALLTIPKALRLGEHLLGLRQISEDDLYRALSIQAGIPFGPPDKVDRRAARALPAAAAQRWRVLPYKVEAGQLHLAATDVPSEEMLIALSGLSSLEPRFRLVPPRVFERMAARYLPRSY